MRLIFKYMKMNGMEMIPVPEKNNKNYMEADWVVTLKRPFQWFWPSENEIRLPPEAVGTPFMDLSALTI